MDRTEVLDLSQDLMRTLAEHDDRLPLDVYNRLLTGILALAGHALTATRSPSADARAEILTRLAELRPGTRMSRHTLLAPMRPRFTTDEVGDTLEQLEGDGLISRELVRPTGPGRPTTMYQLIQKESQL